MTSQPGTQAVVIHIFHNISGSKEKTIKIGSW